MRHALAVVLALVLAAAAGALPARSEDPAALAQKPPALAVVRIGANDHPFCTGFWVGGSTRLIVTAGHCPIDEDVRVPFQVWLTDGQVLLAVLAGWSRPDFGLSDFAVLAVIEPVSADWKPVQLNCGPTLRLGDLVTMDSFPRAVAPFLIHAEGALVIDGPVTFLDGLESTPVYVAALPVAPGSSGGPVFGADGRVVAIGVAVDSEQPAWSFLQPIKPVCDLLHLS